MTMKTGDIFIGLDGKRYRLGKTVWSGEWKDSLGPIPPPTEQAPMTSPSYIIVERETGNAVAEFYSPAIVKLVNPDKYETIPVMKYLNRLNARINAQGE